MLGVPWQSSVCLGMGTAVTRVLSSPHQGHHPTVQYSTVPSRIPFPDVGCHMETVPRDKKVTKYKTPIRALRSQTCWPEGIWKKLSLKAACMLEVAS